MLLAGGAANANNLTGTYSFVGNDSCLLSFSPFKENALGLGLSTPANAEQINGLAQGFAVFNANGTGTMTVNSTWVVIQYSGIALPNAGVTAVNPFFISTYEGTIAFTYTVTGDEFTLTETSDNGPANLNTVGDTLTVTGAPPVNGTISTNSPPVLQIATGTPAQETWLFDCATLYAMCLRTRTFTKVKD